MAKRRTPDAYLPLSVRYFTDDDIITAGPAAAALDIALCCWCKANHKDGQILKTQLRTAYPWPIPKGAMEKLITAGLWADEGTHFVRRNWFKWNPSQEEFEAASQTKRDSGIQGNHDRWHSIEKPMKECDRCIAEGWTW